MKVRLANYSNAENPIITIYKAYRVCYAQGEQSEIQIPTLSNGKLDVAKMSRFIVDKLKRGHTSPLEHVSFTFELNGVSRALTHQLVRHRTGKYSQQSQRYVKLGQFEYVMPPKIKQNIPLAERFVEEMERDQEAYDFFVRGLMEYSIDTSRCNIEGVTDPLDFKKLHPREYASYEKEAIEDARYVFSNACTSNITATFDLHNFRNFYKLRKCQHAQWEIRQLATMMGQVVREILPFALIGAMNCGITCNDCSMKTEYTTLGGNK